MFQPMPTPFASYDYGVISNATIPEYNFSPTPLGRNGGRGSGRSAALDPNAANVYASPAFHNPNLEPNPHFPHQQHQPSSPQDTQNASDLGAPPHRRLSSGPTANRGVPRRHRNSHSVKGEHPIKMELQSDLAQQEAAAQDYKPQLKGPMVGEQTPSHAITEEYAKADPTFVAKTMSLPQTYSHYRPIQGDGNCGWRAIFFGYFECLIQSGDVGQVQAELDRLTGLNDYLATVGGYDPVVFEDMYEETRDLMNEVMEVMANRQDAMLILTQKFNTDATAHPLLYHLRLLAAAWLKGNLNEFAPYIVGDVNSYCEEWILPVSREIDHLGLMLLIGVLLKPANMVLEIAYLDRSEGDTVNVHRMPDDANIQDPSVLARTIHLLYRPGHYDLLYRLPPNVPPSATAPLQINRVASFTHRHEIQSHGPSLQNFANANLSLLSMIPSYDQAGIAVASPSSTASPIGDGYSPSPQSPWVQQPYAEALTAQAVSQPSPVQQQQSIAPISSEVSLRFSKYNFPQLPGVLDATSYTVEPAFTTSTFKNSHYNTAHYNNPHFQPEEYRPEYDDESPPIKSGGRKRSHEHCGVTKKGQ